MRNLELIFLYNTFSTMPDNMDDIELKNIHLQLPSVRSLSRDDSSVTEEIVVTDRGNILVAVQGSKNKPAILTYHDIGLNCKFAVRKCFSKISKTFLCRHFKFPSVLQLHRHASVAGKLLRLPCECSRSRRRRQNITSKVSLFLLLC